MGHPWVHSVGPWATGHPLIPHGPPMGRRWVAHWSSTGIHSAGPWAARRSRVNPPLVCVAGTHHMMAIRSPMSLQNWPRSDHPGWVDRPIFRSPVVHGSSMGRPLVAHDIGCPWSSLWCTLLAHRSATVHPGVANGSPMDHLP